MIRSKNQNQVPSVFSIRRRAGGHPRNEEEHSPATSSLITKNMNDFFFPPPPFCFLVPDAALRGNFGIFGLHICFQDVSVSMLCFFSNIRLSRGHRKSFLQKRQQRDRIAERSKPRGYSLLCLVQASLAWFLFHWKL